MTNEEMEALRIHPASYRFEDERGVRVEWRGTGMWAVMEGGCCLNTDGVMEYEPLPSNRDKAFFERTRFSLDDALRRASIYVYQK